MATKGHDHHHHHQTTLHSSIALLQERFRQLEKIREMRQEKELMNVSSSVSYSNKPHNNYPYNFYHSSSFFSNSEEVIFEQKPPNNSQLGLSLWPENSQIKQFANLGTFETANGKKTTSSTKSWLAGTTLGHDDSTVAAAIFKFDESNYSYNNNNNNIDTSLHL
ncbi:hypothetical protein M9H77_11209 [Catharanthus roseus]|uniref:Uncharacterized protein n=1 Tax=Catharanthus roseus TaxID=4058 RepID=A0ACC0BDZ4_CATRO|nr:hypothetical protein M9H77_11209 [Catharanthus roseus]